MFKSKKKKSSFFLSYILYLSLFSPLFFFVTELFFGNWIRNYVFKENYVTLPNFIKDVDLKFDARRIYSSDKKVNISYSRDKLGYRSMENKSKKPIVLTIGASTTDQRYVSEGETWQDTLDNLIPKYDFVNGGVDGHSIYGTLLSVRSWHSKALKDKEVKFVIYYSGHSDISFMNSNSFIKNQSSKDILSENSFYFSKIKNILNRIKFYKDNNTPILTTHLRRQEDFVNPGEQFDLRESNLNIYLESGYKETFISLINELEKSFPNSEIFIIQQQIPGCNFISKTSVFDRHPKKYKEYNTKKSICNDLMYLYNIQSSVNNNIEKKSKIKILPMYLESIISDSDVYDYVHTNSDGSRLIGNYIYRNIKF